MASMCGSSKSHPALTTSSFYRPGAYPYQNDYYLPPRSAWSRVPPHTSKSNRGSSTWKVGSAMLIVIAMLVLVAVLAIAGLALWMGALRADTKNAVVGFVGNFRITRGEKYNPMLKLNTSMVFREKEQKYKNIFELLFRRSVLGPSYRQAIIDKFENNTLKVFFRLYLDRRKIPRSITNVEDTVEDIIAKETYSVNSLFKDMELDLTSITVKRLNPEGAANPKPAPSQQRNTMITKNGILRPNRNISLITTHPKTNHNVKSKPEPIDVSDPESEIDFSNIPTIKGTYTAINLNATGSRRDEVVVPSSTTTTTTTTTTSTTTTTAAPSSSSSTTTSEATTTVKVRTTTLSSSGSIETGFHEFKEPDLETSPWRPIIPPYLNSDHKLGPGVVTTAAPSVVTQKDKKDDGQSAVDKLAEIKKIVVDTLPATNTLVPPLLIALDDEDSVFPHDRVVPQEMVNFRVNGKFKNKPPASSAVSPIYEESTENGKPKIEVSGQLPPDTYDLRLKASPNGQPIPPVQLPGVFKTDDEIKYTSVEPNFPGFDEEDEQPTILTGIGVAEPVLDTELDLESRNRYSEIMADEPNEKLKSPLDNLKPHQPQQNQPVYTSYKTPDLMGGSKPPLVRVPGTLKPFSHTIPVDKISPAMDDVPAPPMDFMDPPMKIEKPTRGQKPIPNLERIVEIETFVKDVTEPPANNSNSTSNSDSTTVETLIDDEKVLKMTTTEVMSEFLHPEFNNGEKLVVGDEGSGFPSRNTTFVKVDMIKHVPGVLANTSEDSVQMRNLTSEDSSQPTTTTQQTTKNVYNDTLKANVVIDLVTLAPVKSNTGVGRPIRPRPKRPQPPVESKNRTAAPVLPVASISTVNTSEDTVLLERLFGLQSADSDSKRESPEQQQRDFAKDPLPETIEQIVEVVTSISTKVSSSVKDDQMILKLVITNSTAEPDHTPPNKISTVTTTSTVTPNSDRKIATAQDNQFLVDNLRKFASVRTGNEPATKKPKTESAPPPSPMPTRYKPDNLVDLEKLKQIADVVARGNKTVTVPKETTVNFALSRDGVPVMTKTLTKAEERNDKMISTTEENQTSQAQICHGFQCGDGKCLPIKGRCNMLSECANSEDEANCTCADFLKVQLLHKKICDGTVDCWDYSDEADCDWCRDGQFVCGNSRFCVDQSSICDGIRDCPYGEDEKKCAALIDDDLQLEDSSKPSAQVYREFFTSGNEDIFEDIDRKDDNVEENHTTEEVLEEELPEGNLRDVVSGREISSSKTRGNNNLVGSIRADVKTEGPFAKYSNRLEVNNFNDRGFLNVRKNGQWGKLCLSDADSLLQRRQLSWTIEDLGRAVCKAITYQDFDKVEKVQEDSPSLDKTYYSLSLNDNKSTDRTSLTLKKTKCQNGQVLKVKCKNFECGIRTQVPSQARIVGGGSSSAGSWPWQVALYKEGDYQCGGVIVSDRWIVSAAHCFYRAQDEYWVARIGATRRGNFASPYEQVIRLDYIILHPDYVDISFVNDIALLRLEKPLTFSDYVRPVCLPTSEPKIGTTCTVTGWGQLFEIGRLFPDTLQEVELPIIPMEECRKETFFISFNTSGMLCAGVQEGGKDACLGDSGGPLVCSESDNKYTLNGITSNGHGCGRKGRPGVYTKVHYYLDWIERVTSRTDIPSTVTSCKGHRCPLGECLPKSRLCNGFLECSDGSDERNCPRTR
ncbi:uncharacterized protein LOC100116291 isoform X3 [Nasonia vitripennis]|uniref:Uncharacterized protein n=1 Tax=Nasonia vitripennis TaxID=7425 RepID=A0A7M7G2W8_NASVI|nr:uncharacterized protein LOC100116291 isoform X3 [Nasonia vitripennis]